MEDIITNPTEGVSTETSVNDKIICLTYDELLEVLDNDSIRVVNVWGPPPPDERVNSKWVWKKPQPIMGWKVEVKWEVV